MWWYGSKDWFTKIFFSNKETAISNVEIDSTVSKDILLAPHLAFTISAIVGSTGVTNNAEGRKVIPAGTPVGGTTSVLATRSTVLQVTNTNSNGANAQGVLLHDVDVTNGNANGTLLINGFVNTNRLTSATLLSSGER